MQLTDHIDDNVELGEHGNMAALHLDDSRSHMLRDPPLEIWVHSVILRGQNVPTRLRLPWGACNLLLLEQIGDGRIVGAALLIRTGTKAARSRLAHIFEPCFGTKFFAYKI